jgi:hypothetical protein
MKPTVCLIVRKNETTIEQTLLSLKPIAGELLVGLVGDRDSSEDVCRKHGARVIPLAMSATDLATAKNAMLSFIKDGWVMFIEPWEVLIEGEDHILDACNKPPASYHLSVLQGNLISKEIRLWHVGLKLRFQNPVFETVMDDHSLPLIDSILFTNYKGDLQEKEDLVDKWISKRITDAEPYYYRTCVLLAQGKFEEFLKAAEQYLFLSRHGISAVMTQYYMSMVQCYVKNDHQAAVKSVLACIALKPTMAEFWSLLGDIYYKCKQYEKAEVFYDNAIVLGERRMNTDVWPLDISKYLDHPSRMKESCRKIIEESVIVQGTA